MSRHSQAPPLVYIHEPPIYLSINVQNYSELPENTHPISNYVVATTYLTTTKPFQKNLDHSSWAPSFSHALNRNCTSSLRGVINCPLRRQVPKSSEPRISAEPSDSRKLLAIWVHVVAEMAIRSLIRRSTRCCGSVWIMTRLFRLVCIISMYLWKMKLFADIVHFNFGLIGQPIDSNHFLSKPTKMIARS